MCKIWFESHSLSVHTAINNTSRLLSVRACSSSCLFLIDHFPQVSCFDFIRHFGFQARETVGSALIIFALIFVPPSFSCPHGTVRFPVRRRLESKSSSFTTVWFVSRLIARPIFKYLFFKSYILPDVCRVRVKF